MVDISELGRQDHNVEAEKGLLSVFLKRPENVLESQIKPEYFKCVEHAKICRAIQELSTKWIAIDATTVADKLGDDLETVGGIDYIYELAGRSYSVIVGKDYESIIIDYARRRRFIHTFERAKMMSVSKQSLEDIVKVVYEWMGDDVNTDKPFSLIMDSIERMESEIPSEKIICQTMYTKLDEALTGYRQWSLVIIGARPSTGKSTLILNMMARVMQQWIQCALFSTEMLRDEVSDRFISMSLSLDLKKVERREDEVKEKIIDWFSSYAADVRVYDRIPWFQYIVNNIRREASQGTKIVYIDYLQQIFNGGNFANRNNEVGDMTTKLKMLANELKICIVLAAQLNRQSEARADRKPTKSDLRDSGNIEQDADIVILLHDEAMYDPYSDKKDILLLIIDKNRHGQRVNVEFKKQLQYFKLNDPFEPQ